MTEAWAIRFLLGIVVSLLWYIWRESRKATNGVGAKVSKIVAFLAERETDEGARKRITDIFFK